MTGRERKKRATAQVLTACARKKPMKGESTKKGMKERALPTFAHLFPYLSRILGERKKVTSEPAIA